MDILCCLKVFTLIQTYIHRYYCIYRKFPKVDDPLVALHLWQMVCGGGGIRNSTQLPKERACPDTDCCEHKSCLTSEVFTFSRRMVRDGQVGAVISWSTASKSVRTFSFKTFTWTHWTRIWERKQQQPVVLIETAQHLETKDFWINMAEFGQLQWNYSEFILIELKAWFCLQLFVLVDKEYLLAVL